MALVSPGVEVQVVDESAYGAPGAGTAPLLVIATRENKTDPTGSEADGIAKFTKSAQAGNIVSVTSQRELTQFFGNPIFRTDTADVVIQGDETSEYGLLAAYSYLGQGNRAYVVRADVDLAKLEPSSTAPTSAWSTNNAIWIDTDASKFGIHEYDAVTGLWINKVPTVEVDQDASTAEAAGTYTPTTPVTNGAYLVTIVADQGGNVAVQYWKGVSGSWEVINSDAPMSDGETVTLAPHYSTPAAPAAGDVWIKTTQPGNGIDLALYFYTTVDGEFKLQTVSGVTTAQTAGLSTAIVDFIPQDGTSVTPLSATTASEGSWVIDFDANTTNYFVIQRVGAAGALIDTNNYTKRASINFPTEDVTEGELWFKPELDELDIYVVDNSEFVKKAASYGTTPPSAPTDGDVWINTVNADTNQVNERAYPDIRVWNTNLGVWVQHDNTDQTTNRGVLFANITKTFGDDTNAGAATTLAGAPDPLVHPNGMIAVNMAQSSNTVRVWDETLGTWLNAVSNHADGSGRFGRFAQRQFVANKMQAAMQSTDLREPQYTFTLIAAPNYPEVYDEMVNLNVDRGETAFIIVDTPMRKTPQEATLWVQNVAVAAENGEDGLVSKDTYSAVYYPSGLTTEPVNGNSVVVPPSHMALYTYAYNDNVSFQWFAPAGLTRGVVQNAASVGYLTTEGEYKAVALSQGQRDDMYINKLNPITTFVGQGTVVFGQKTLHQFDSALDRVNVARLVAYLRERFEHIARPFLFEINDQQTRDRAKLVFERFLADILSRRGIYDFAVVCDETNNTPARIDRNELYIDVAIEPAKVAEFIYIPIRIVNTGTLSNTV
jgi:hypothetical protein